MLKLVGMILKQSATGSAKSALYGGEEFAIVMPRADLSQAVTLAETVRTTVASKRSRKKLTSEDFGNITMSIDAAQFKPGEPIADLIQRADECLHHAKNTGRNQVATEHELQAVVSD